MQKDYSAYLTNALSCDVVLTADLIYCKFPSIVKKKRPNYPFHAEKAHT